VVTKYSSSLCLIIMLLLFQSAESHAPFYATAPALVLNSVLPRRPEDAVTTINKFLEVNGRTLSNASHSRGMRLADRRVSMTGSGSPASPTSLLPNCR